MSYHVKSLAGGSYKLVFEDEPAYCKALVMSPLAKESELTQGLWLVLLFAVWSVPDRSNIGVALSVVKEFNGKVFLGVRPFDNHDEIKKWCPEVKEKYGSPIWLVMKNGKLLKERTGLYSKEELKNLIQSVI